MPQTQWLEYVTGVATRPRQRGMMQLVPTVHVCKTYEKVRIVCSGSVAGLGSYVDGDDFHRLRRHAGKPYLGEKPPNLTEEHGRKEKVYTGEYAANV